MWLLFGAIVDCPIQRSLCDTNNQWVVIFSFSDPSHEQMSLRPFTKPHADSPSTLSILGSSLVEALYDPGQ